MLAFKNLLEYAIVFIVIGRTVSTLNAFCHNISNQVKYEVDTVNNYKKVFFYNFKKMTDLLVSNCNQAYNIPNASEIDFVPNQPILIDNSFTLDKLVNVRDIYSVSFIVLNRIKGLDVNTTHRVLENYLTRVNSISLGVFFSTIDTYFSNGSKTSADDCNQRIFARKTNLYQPFSSIIFKTVIYPKNICPLVFKDTLANEFYFGDITNSYIIKNPLNFIKTNETKQLPYLAVILLDMYYEHLSAAILEPRLFAGIKELKVNHIVGGIHSDVFVPFKMLKYIDFDIDNLGTFFNQGTSWMRGLNADISVNLSNTKKVHQNLNKRMLIRFQRRLNVSFNHIYEYPEKDICLFRNFPHRHLVLPIIVPGKRLKCTCTLKWLQLYAHLYEPEIKIARDYAFNYDKNNYQENYFLVDRRKTFVYCNDSFKCDFATIFNRCHPIVSAQSNKFRLDNDVDIYFVFKWIYFICVIILQPVLCLIGLINNSLVLLVIKNKRTRKLFKDPMYTHIGINAVFNLAYCTILLLSMVNICLSFNSSVFCSSVYQNNSAQYFKIVGVYFLGNVFKLCSNMSYLYFTFSRFVLISDLKATNPLKRIAHVHAVIYVGVLVSASGLLSTFKLFEYRPNKDWDERKEFPYEIQSELFCFFDDNSSNCRIFYVFKLVNKFLNDILCFVLNIFVDICLLKMFNRNIRHKQHFGIRKDNSETNTQKVKTNINRMIITNGVLYFVAHAPEFVSTLLLVIYSRRIKSICTEKITCDGLNDVAQLFTLISITSQLYVFFLYNKNFKTSMSDLLQRFQNKFSGKKNQPY